MATDTRVINSSIASDVDFRACVAGLRAMLAAAGLVQTADTGQLDPATVVRPTSGGSVAAGYEIYRFADALQATLPVYIKVEYGTGFAANNFGWWFTVGTGTNGAGVLTGQVSGRRQQYPLVVGANNWYCSGSQGADGGRFAMIANYIAANGNGSSFLCIERTRDANGNPTADGIIFFGLQNAGSTALAFLQHVPAAGLVPAGVNSTSGVQYPTLGGGPSYASGKSIIGLNVGLLPTIALLGKVLFGTPLYFAPADIGDLSTIVVNQFGAAHTFMCFGSGMNYSNVMSNIITGIAIRWE